MKNILLIILILTASFLLFSDEIEEDGLITISRTTKLNEAVRAIESVSQETEGVKIINRTQIDQELGIPINKLHWRDALKMLITLFDLDTLEYPGVFELFKEDAKEKQSKDGVVELRPDSKQIRISSIFFKSDKNLTNSIGINWSTIMNGKVDATVDFNAANNISDEIIGATASTNISNGTVNIDINTLLKIIEGNQMGSVIARPNITVVSGRRGFIQVGEDFSVTTVDDAGNTIEKFFETGIILDVEANILGKGVQEVIHLKAIVEKSSAVPGELSTIISRNKSETEVLLYDGEETYIGGLYDTDLKIHRSGVPILKDLPWWVFGLRYIFGYSSTIESEGEMIIILKAEVVESVETRKALMPDVKKQISESREADKATEFLFQEEPEEQPEPGADDKVQEEPAKELTPEQEEKLIEKITGDEE
jgi:general secretion pathway protein D